MAARPSCVYEEQSLEESENTQITPVAGETWDSYLVHKVRDVSRVVPRSVFQVGSSVVLAVSQQLLFLSCHLPYVCSSLSCLHLSDL